MIEYQMTFRQALRGHRGRRARRFLRRGYASGKWLARSALKFASWDPVYGWEEREDRRRAKHWPAPAQLLHRTYRGAR